MTLGCRTQGDRSVIELPHQVSEIGPGEVPDEGPGDALVVLLEGQQSHLDLREGREVVGREHLAPHDREVDLDLVEPTGMDRAVHGHEGRIGRLEPADAGGTAMRGAVVQDPEDAVGVVVRGLGHDLGDEALERRDAGRGLAAAEELGAMDVPGGQVGPGAPAVIFVFHPHGRPRLRGAGRMAAHPGLDAGLLVGAEHEVLRVQGFSRPLPGVQVEDPPGLGGEVRIAGKDPGPVLPRADGVFVKPPPHRLVAEGGDEPAALRLPHDVGAAQAGERQAPGDRQLTGEGLDLHDDLGGERPAGGPGAGAPPTRPSVRRRSVCARG